MISERPWKVFCDARPEAWRWQIVEIPKQKKHASDDNKSYK